MPTTEPTHTLIRDLEDEADAAESWADEECSDTEWANEIKLRASRLRNAAKRMRDEWNYQTKLYSLYADAACEVICRINGGEVK